MSEPSELAAEAAAAAGAGSVAATEAFNSVKVSLADLCAKGTAEYARKGYSEASDYYARASELQAELNGEMHPDNAEILFLYGRSLFRVGQGKSDVLGGRGAAAAAAGGGEEKKRKNNNGNQTKKDRQQPKAAAATAPTTGGAEPASANGAVASAVDRVAEEGIALMAEPNGVAAAAAAAKMTKAEDVQDAKKPLFQFTGDENFEDSDDDEEEEEGAEEEEEEEEEDDLAAAFEVLDLARVLYIKRLEQAEEDEGEGKSTSDSSVTKHVKERLSDTHDLLAEISLENERFPNAVSDFKAALSYKKDLHPTESEIIAEAHFKLSLALEFASITTTKDGGGDEDAANDGDDAGEAAGAPPVKEAQVDEAMREEAARELELAIESTRLKLQSKEVELATCNSPEDNEVTRTQIGEVKEIVADMEQRLLDLRAPPVDVNVALNGGPAGGAPDGLNPMGGILGAALGESPAAAAARIAEAKKTATDLTGLVRRKKDKSASSDSGPANAATAATTAATAAAAAPAAPAAPTLDSVKEDELAAATMAAAAAATAAATAPVAGSNGKRKADEVDADADADAAEPPKKAKVEEELEAKAEEVAEEEAKTAAAAV